MSPRHIAFYGLLNPGHGPFEKFRLAEALDLVGPCRIPGRLHDLGAYPGLTRRPGMTEGRLYRIRDPRVLRLLDAFEAYWPRRPKQSEYLRRPVLLANPALWAWVYVYNRKPPAGSLAPEGPWAPAEPLSGCRARAVRNRFAASW
ncbi:gamma-glutamylcyclotransferase family protein [Emcibacter sp. SYSU 3D8]|uniref:gamma-glutamylcyclotransferase family protein n=1 Tax=Emcibacter sp. SYSU 3D8 TaxID=3133969 RepID=UPI0031FEA48B